MGKTFKIRDKERKSKLKQWDRTKREPKNDYDDKDK
jgi:hypothetical protein